MFIDAKEIEENFWAYGKLLHYISDEDLDAEEKDKDYEQQRSYLGLHSFQHGYTSSLNFYLSSNLTTSQSYFSIIEDVESLYQQDGFSLGFHGGPIVGSSRGLLIPTRKLLQDQFVENEVVALKCLVVEIGDTRTFFCI